MTELRLLRLLEHLDALHSAATSRKLRVARESYLAAVREVVALLREKRRGRR